MSFDVCTNGTGSAANQVNWTTTNLTGSPVYSFSIAALDLPTLVRAVCAASQIDGSRHGGNCGFASGGGQ
jgi:hypothetical protein